MVQLVLIGWTAGGIVDHFFIQATWDRAYAMGRRHVEQAQEISRRIKDE